MPDCAPAGKTVWFRFTPPATGVLTASTAGSQFDTVLAIYEGSALTALTQLACNDDSDPGLILTSEAMAVVSAGKAYAIQLAGFDGEGGLFRLEISLDTSRTSLPTRTPTATPSPTSSPTPTLTATVTPTSIATATISAVAASGSSTVAGVTAGSSASGAAGAPDRSAVPVIATFSAHEPWSTTLTLSGGQPLVVLFDAEAAGALRSALPSVTSVRLSYDPAPLLENEAQRGSLGGGNVIPMSHPISLGVELLDAAGRRVRLPQTATEVPEAVTVSLTLPVLVQPPQLDRVFGWLHAVYDRRASRDVGETGAFLGYVRPPATFDPRTGTLRVQLSLDLLQAEPGTPATAGTPATTSATPTMSGPPTMSGTPATSGTLFLPAVIVRSWVQNFDPDVHVYSGPTLDAIDYGIAGPQFTTFTVVAPQIAGRLHVFNPVTQNYGWIDARGVGPAGPPVDGS